MFYRGSPWRSRSWTAFPEQKNRLQIRGNGQFMNRPYRRWLYVHRFGISRQQLSGALNRYPLGQARGNGSGRCDAKTGGHKRVFPRVSGDATGNLTLASSEALERETFSGLSEKMIAATCLRVAVSLSLPAWAIECTDTAANQIME